MTKPKKVYRVWTIYAAPCIAERLTAVPGLAARVFHNAGCTIYADEQVVTSAERYVQACDEPGGLIYTKKSTVDVVTVVPLSGGRSFMPDLDTRGEATRRPGFWADAYKAAGDALVEFLTKRPKP